ncbi:MAG: HEAT repeat domain-containing protein [Pedobacter sp.]|nr:MAG: HEAT repeat domain-containing protein [Pedobacter sp.]
MNDPLKKFIDHNRDDFDDLEPSPEIFFKVKEELKEKYPEKKQPVLKLAFSQKWLVAASVVIVLFAGYLIFKGDESIKTITEQQTVSNKKLEPNVEKNNHNKTTNQTINQSAIAKNTGKKYKAKTLVNKEKKFDGMSAIYEQLTDSSSSSTRLAAIIKIQQSGTISYDIIDKLAKTLDADNNSNVRLAALSLMGTYNEDSYIGSKLINAIHTQKDPIVQLGLIELLRKTDNPKLDDRLYALANDPNTFTAVKDQAYSILLNQNKL